MDDRSHCLLECWMRRLVWTITVLLENANRLVSTIFLPPSPPSSAVNAPRQTPCVTHLVLIMSVAQGRACFVTINLQLNPQLVLISAGPHPNPNQILPHGTHSLTSLSPSFPASVLPTLTQPDSKQRSKCLVLLNTSCMFCPGASCFFLSATSNPLLIHHSCSTSR